MSHFSRIDGGVQPENAIAAVLVACQPAPEALGMQCDTHL